jgi:hypothetical protein
MLRSEMHSPFEEVVKLFLKREENITLDNTVKEIIEKQ